MQTIIILSGFDGHAMAGYWGRFSVFFSGQWHPFAVISPAKHEIGGKRHQVLIAKAGDWTANRIAEGNSNPRRWIYVRLIKAPGFM